MWRVYAVFLLAVGVLVAGGIVVYRAQPWTQATRGQEVIAAGQSILRQSVPGGGQAVFGAAKDTLVEAFPDGKVRVSGSLDLVGADGKPDPQHYSIIVFRNAAGKWQGESIEVVPRL